MMAWCYMGQYQHKKLKFYAQYAPITPEKFICGVVGKHGKRLDTFAEFKIDQNDKTETCLGYKTRFVGGEIRGNITSTGKV